MKVRLSESKNAGLTPEKWIPNRSLRFYFQHSIKERVLMTVENSWLVGHEQVVGIDINSLVAELGEAYALNLKKIHNIGGSYVAMKWYESSKKYLSSRETQNDGNVDYELPEWYEMVRLTIMFLESYGLKDLSPKHNSRISKYESKYLSKITWKTNLEDSVILTLLKKFEAYMKK